MKKIYYAIPLFALLFLGGCDVINPEEDIPAYLRIEPFEFDRGGFPGSRNAKIPLAFVYVNGEILGIYELPVTVPVLASGSTNILIDPGIENNGISSTPEDYPFYERFETDIELEPGKTTSIRPTTTYSSFTQIVNFEDFEGNFNAFTFDIDGIEDTELINSNEDVFSGSTSGYIRLTESNPVISVGSELITEFPPQGSRVYLELNYKSDIQVAIGIIPFTSDGFVVREGEDQNKGFNARTSWNKIYFDFSETFLALSNLPEVASFRISVTTILPADYNEEVAEVFLDELQLVWRR